IKNREYNHAVYNLEEKQDWPDFHPDDRAAPGIHSTVPVAMHEVQTDLNLNVKIKKKFHYVYAHISSTTPRNVDVLPLHPESEAPDDGVDHGKYSETDFLPPLLHLPDIEKTCRGNNIKPR